MLTDGNSVAQAMLSAELNELVVAKKITQQAMLSLDEYMCTVINATQVIIVIRARVIDTPPQADSVVISSLAAAASATAELNNDNDANENAFVCIKSLNIESSYRYWAIKCRVILKSAVRTWKNDRGEGRCFSVDLIDKDGDAIRATLFNTIADQLHTMLCVNHIYIVSGARIQVTNRDYNPLPHSYQLTIEHPNQIKPVARDDISIPKQQFSFIKMNVISSSSMINSGHLFDVIGMAIRMQPIVTVSPSKQTRSEIRKRQLTVIDETGQIELTLWGNNIVESPEPSCAFVVAVKNANVTEFGGETMIGTNTQSQVLIDPQIREAESLKIWYVQAAPQTVNFSASSMSYDASVPTTTHNWHTGRRTPLASITENRLGQVRIDWITVRVTIVAVGHDSNNIPCYPSCPVCTKKVIQSANIPGCWHCDACNQTYSAYQPRYVLNVHCADASGTRWITAFNDVATKILGNISAADLCAMAESADRYNSVLQSAIGRQFFFRVRLKRSVDTSHGTDINPLLSLSSSDGHRVRALAIDLVVTEYDINTDRPHVTE